MHCEYVTINKKGVFSMKKITKILALFMTAIVLMSSFSIMSGAISSKSSAKELLDYYENCIITTSAKEDVVKANEVYKVRSTANYSSLQGEDLEATKEENETFGYGDGTWQEDKFTEIYYCDPYEDYYWEGRSEFVDFFSIKTDIRRSELKFKSVKYSKADNGDVTLVFVYTSTFDGGTPSTWTYTLKIGKNNYLKSYSINRYETFVEYSIGGTPYTVKHETVDSFNFIYNKVDVKAIELSENDIVIGKDEERIITVAVKPDNATFKDFYINWDETEYDVADCEVLEDGTILVYATGKGKTSFDVCSYTGDVVETVNVTVKYTFAELVKEFFENIWEEFFWFIWMLIPIPY